MTVQLPEFVCRPHRERWHRGAIEPAYPKLSVVTPSFNQASYIERTILSVLNQGYPNLEYIVIDGGSTDGSQAIIERYREHLIFWEDPDDRGQVSAINKGFQRATGDWVAFQNSDDLYAPGAFAAVARAIRKTPEAGLVYGQLLFIGDDDVPYEEKRQTPFSRYALIYQGMQYHNQALFFRKTLLGALGYLDERYHYSFDYELMARFGSSPLVRKVLVPDFWGAFRTHPAAKTATVSAADQHERVQISNDYRTMLPVRLPAVVIRLYDHLYKFLYFLSQGDWTYLWYRSRLKTGRSNARAGSS